MEVVINVCFGGFNLSDEAIEECIKRGMTVTKYKEGRYEDPTADFVKCDDDDLFNRKYTEVWERKKSLRTNPILVNVVKEFGERANGCFSELKVVNIPFNSLKKWYIDDYDGKENISEASRRWM